MENGSFTAADVCGSGTGGAWCVIAVLGVDILVFGGNPDGSIQIIGNVEI
jgi:hypothetical protein